MGNDVQFQALFFLLRIKISHNKAVAIKKRSRQLSVYYHKMTYSINICEVSKKNFKKGIRFWQIKNAFEIIAKLKCTCTVPAEHNKSKTFYIV